MNGSLPISIVCGQLVVGGFAGTSMSSSFARALSAGERGGAVLFKRNLVAASDADRFAQLEAVADLNRAIAAASPRDLPPLISVDQEGGRVARLGPPALRVPPMKTLAAIGDEAFAESIATTQARELASVGFTMNFAPVLDANTRPENPIIGDRAFGSDPDLVARFGIAYARGLERGGLLSCGKHFPGHGDTTKDSHFDLPRVDRSRPDLDRIELAPFRAAAEHVDALMSAHVEYPSLDAEWPATLSRRVCTDLLRTDFGFKGLLISDDLEMKAISDRYGIEDAACRAIDAGCDVLLICSDEGLQDKAHAALVRRAEADSDFRARCVNASERFLAARRRVSPKPLAAKEVRDVFAASHAVASDLAMRALSYEGAR